MTLEKSLIHERIEEWILNGDEPFLFRADGRRQFRSVLLGAQDANHPFFSRLGQYAPNHLEPLELFGKVTGRVVRSGVSVLSIGLPWDELTIAEMARTTSTPPASWFAAKANFLACIPYVYELLSEICVKRGTTVIEPESCRFYHTQRNSAGLSVSNWSERHIAFACGLGTFGHHGGIITAQGVALRLMSFLVGEDFDEYAVVPDKPFRDCLFLSRGTCGVCAHRCPISALSLHGRDGFACQRFVWNIADRLPSSALHGVKDACGFCMTGVPCAKTRPKKSEQVDSREG